MGDQGLPMRYLADGPSGGPILFRHTSAAYVALVCASAI
jgi:hypothetical protein